ncbi:interleukin-17F-like [Pelobates fuscus]|uniref:interleukin-17F-like n=1 Tax=Pelobates fuscus TaxID=191477 RepID=UPI002FE4DF44
MAFRRLTYLLLASVLMGFSTSAFLPQEYLAENVEKEFSSYSESRCPGRRLRRPPHRINLDISAVDATSMDDLSEIMDIQSRSLAPWDFSLDMDPNRYPMVISEANCLSSVCTDSSWNENPELISLPIQQDIMVLTREQKDCDYVYKLESKRVTVGCTCVWPNEFEVNPMEEFDIYLD